MNGHWTWYECVGVRGNRGNQNSNKPAPCTTMEDVQLVGLPIHSMDTVPNIPDHQDEEQ